MCNNNFRIKVVKHEFMFNFYLKDKPACILYLYFINYTRKKTYLLAILINNYSSKMGLYTWSGPFQNMSTNLRDVFFKVGFTLD